MSSPTSEADFQFWAVTIPKNSEKELKMENDNSVYHVSNATLGNKVSGGRTTIFFKSNGKQAPICNLVNNTLENASLDLIVSRSMNASFVTKGPNEVTVSGYVQPLADESDSDMMPTVMELPPTNGADGAVEIKASEAKAPEAPEEEKPAPIEEEKESKKRKLDEVDTAEVSKPPEKKQKNKKKKKKKKKKNQKLAEGTEAPVTTQSNSAAEPMEVEKAPIAEPVVEENKSESVKEEAVKETPTREAKPKSAKKSKKLIKAGKGVKYRVLKKGKAGVNPAKKGDTITLLYVGSLKDGTQFDKNLKTGLTFKIGGDEVIPGIEAGVLGMCPNEKRRIIIPPEQGYGEDGASDGQIPPNSELHFTVQRKK